MDPLSFARITPPELPAMPRAGQPARAEPGSFANLLSDAVERVQQTKAEADQELRGMLAGEPVELHRVLLAGEKASLAAELLMAVRNKAVEAYQEIMRMQV